MKTFIKTLCFYGRIKTKGWGKGLFSIEIKVKAYPVIFDVIYILKEENHSRCIDFKKLLKMQALVRFHI
jgi:hypothetical protein